ncbi:MAG: hypothetical protein Q9160_007132 [Pyrenula sp. 1 TL-2023]
MENSLNPFGSLTETLLPTPPGEQGEKTTSRHRHRTTSLSPSTLSTTPFPQATSSQSSNSPTITHSAPTKTKQAGKTTFSPSSSTISSLSNSSTTTSSSASSSSSLSPSSTSETLSSSATVPANPLGGPTGTSSASVSKHGSGSSVSKAGIAIGVILSLVVFGAIFFLLFRQRDRFKACIARHRGQRYRNDEEAKALKRPDAREHGMAHATHSHKYMGSDTWPIAKAAQRKSYAPVGASLDRPFSHPTVMDTSNEAQTSPAVSPISAQARRSEVIDSPLQSQYKPWARPYKYTPYTYERAISNIPPTSSSKPQMGPPGRVLPTYAKAKARDGVWEVDDPNHQLLEETPSQPSR